MATPAQTTAPAISDEEKAKKWESLPAEVREGIENLNGEIKRHNANVSLVREFGADKGDEKKIMQEKLRNGDHGDDLLKKMMEEIEKLESRVESLWQKAVARANTLNIANAEISIDDAKAAYASTKASSAEIRAQRDALAVLEKFFNFNLALFLDDMDTTRGLKIPGEAPAGISSKPRYSQIFVVEENGDKVLISEKVEKKNKETGETVTEDRSSGTILAKEISSRLGRGHTVSGPEITSEFLKSQNLAANEFGKVEAGKEIPWTFNKEIFDSNGNSLGVKSFNLIMVK